MHLKRVDNESALNYKKHKRIERSLPNGLLLSLCRERERKRKKREERKNGENYIPKSMYLGSHPNRLLQVDRKNIQGSSEQ